MRGGLFHLRNSAGFKGNICHIISLNRKSRLLNFGLVWVVLYKLVLVILDYSMVNCV